MKIFKLVTIVFLFVGISNKSFAQDTIHWRPDYKLKWEDFQGVPDSSPSFPECSNYPRALLSLGLSSRLEEPDLPPAVGSVPKNSAFSTALLSLGLSSRLKEPDLLL